MDNLFSSSYDPFRQEIEIPLMEAIRDQKDEEIIFYENKRIIVKKLLYFFTCNDLTQKCAKVYSTRYFANKTTLNEELLILEKIKRSFKHLAIKDLSANDLFARTLSSSWHAILKIQVKYYSLQKINPLIYQKITELIHLVEFYKVEKSEHSLGHYLKTFVGQKWFPFPFIETLKQLHTNALDPSVNSELTQMITLCQASIEALKTLC